MKKDILILAALIAVVIAVPFLATKAEEAIQIKNEEFKEKQNRECYEKAEECMDAGKYDEAIELLEKLPGYYEDVEYIIQYAKFCDAVQNGEGIEELYKLIWYVPKGDEYSSKYIEEMRKAQKDTEEQYKKYMAQKEKEEVIAFIEKKGYGTVEDFGSEDSIYANVAIKVSEAVASGGYDRGILICGTGIGMSISANKVKGAYAALVSDVYSAQRARLSNDANIICMGAFTTGSKVRELLVEAFFENEFVKGCASQPKVDAFVEYDQNR